MRNPLGSTASTKSPASAPPPQAAPARVLGPADEKLEDLIGQERLRDLLGALADATGPLELEDADGRRVMALEAHLPDRATDDASVDIQHPDLATRFGRIRYQLSRASTSATTTARLVRAVAAMLGLLAAQEHEARRRKAELTAIYNTSMMLAEARDLNNLLSRTVRLVADVMGVRGASIRLIDEARDELKVAAVYGLSEAYAATGTLRLSRAEMDHAAMRQGHEQVADLRADPRVQFPELIAAEHVVSMLIVPMKYKAQAIGVLRAYTGHLHTFSATEIELMTAVASQAGAAIVNARLAAESAEAEALERQVLLAADVQQRMVPRQPPACRNLEFASAFVPCFELAGDLYDFIPLSQDRLGVVIADVVGKGVPASLIMATVRAYLRASSEHLDDPAETVRRLNTMLCHDNRSGEFVSLFYGAFDGAARKLEYVLAGHVPPLLLRGGHIEPLGGTEMVLGVVPGTPYAARTMALEPGDRLLLYTDGLDEARNFKEEMYGHARVRHSLAQPAPDAAMMVQNVVWAMRRFVGLRRKSDDVTVIAVRVS